MVDKYVTKEGLKRINMFLIHAHRRKTKVIISIDFMTEQDAEAVLQSLFRD